MYLTDYREMSLKDVITQMEPGLFKKVTGLDVKDFELLCSLGVFNANLMNQAIFSFKRYEDSSLSYTGIDKHEGKDIGGWDTVIKREEYEKMFYNQQATMTFAEAIEEYKADTDEEKKDEVVIKSSKEAEKPLPATKPIVDYKPVPKPAPAAKTPSQKEDDFVMPTLSEGMTVVHRKFGEGVVRKVFQNEKKITVSFSIGEKTFVTDEKSADNAFKKGFLKAKY